MGNILISGILSILNIALPTSNLKKKFMETIMFYPPKYEFPDSIPKPTTYIEKIPCNGYFNHKSNNLIIYAHENNVDIHKIKKFLNELTRKTNCSVVSYDYAGYGNRLNEPFQSDEELVDDLTELLNYFSKMRFNIFLFGSYLGSGIVIKTMAEKNHPFVKGIIVNGTFTSVLEIPQLFNEKIMDWIGNRLNNLKNVRNVKIPILFIHGEKDSRVSIDDGKLVYMNSSNVYSEFFSVEWGKYGALEFKPISDFISESSVL